MNDNMSSVNKLISREELLNGFRGGNRRRAAITLSLIEARTARLVVEKGSVATPFMTEDSFEERCSNYLGAIVDGAKMRSQVSIQNIEQSANVWSSLVPDNPSVRAELARMLSEKYDFNKKNIPQISAAIGLDDPQVGAAFNSANKSSLSSIYQKHLSPWVLLQWKWSNLNAKIENLPPFWTAFSLTLTETVGAGTLALPIAFATVGPLAGVILLVLLGLVNLATVSYLAEASARNGSIRYGSAFVGRLVHDYLGATASIVLRLSLFAFCCIVLASYYTGFASTISTVTGIPEPYWVALVFGAGLILILRKTLVGTLTSALVIGVINISILIFLSVIALNHATVENLTHMEIPYINGRTFEPSHIQLVFGIVLVSYFGHLSVSNCAQNVLRRDPDGRSLKRGTIAAMAVAIAIYSLWSIAVGGAVPSEALLGETGTTLDPLAKEIGPEIYALGVVFAVLGLGMSSVHFGLGIFNMTREFAGKIQKRSQQSWIQKHIATIASVLPIFLVFIYVQWTYKNGTPSFTAPLELLGAILTPVLAGIFPVLLLMASRARGLSVSGAKVTKIASNKLVLACTVLLSFAGLLFHGLVIWEEPISRGAALTTAGLMLYLIFDLMRRKAFSPVLLIEVRYFPENAHKAIVTIAHNGKKADLAALVLQNDGFESTLPSDGVLKDFRSYEKLKLTLPEGAYSKIQINTYRVSADFEAQPIKGYLCYYYGEGNVQSIKLDGMYGSTQTMIPPDTYQVALQLINKKAIPNSRNI